MTKTFEEILGDRKLHELTDTEIEEIVQEMTPQQKQKFEKDLRKKSRSTSGRKNTKKQKERESEFDKVLFGGGESGNGN